MATFLLIIRDKEGDNDLTMEELIKPANFQALVAAVKTIKSPNGRLKVGYHLHRMAQILRGRAIMQGKRELRECAEDFITLYTDEWKARISSATLRHMYDQKLNRRDEIPLTEDLVKLSKVIKDDIVRLTSEMEIDPTKTNGRELSEAVLCHLIVFNKRRGGEMARLLHANFVDATSSSSQSSNVNEEICKSLTELERLLAKRMTIVWTKGKRGRHVPGMENKSFIK